MISIGKYDVLQSDVTLASGRTLHEWSFVDSASTAANRTAVTAQRARWKPVLDGLESRFGPYPGNSIGVVVDRVPAGINYALETQDRSFFPTSIGGEVFVHEAAHQWYGDAVSPRVWNDIWINEGMASWVPVHLDDPTSTESTFYGDWNDEPASSSAWTRAACGHDRPGRPVRLPDLLPQRPDVGGAAAVDRRWRVHRLRARVAAAVRWWEPRPYRLRRLAEEMSGEDLDEFFQDWLLDRQAGLAAAVRPRPARRRDVDAARTG